jgi:cytochrome c oxidase assembly protein subunit 15
VFFALTVALALFTSPRWFAAYTDPAAAPNYTRALTADVALRQVSVLLVAGVYLQILLGAVMRHTGAGLAIPDFPLMFGRLLPPLATFTLPGVGIHFAHRVGALVVTVLLAVTSLRVLKNHPDHRELTRPAGALLVLLVLQIMLGGLTVLSGKDVVINTAHLATGALIFVTAVVLALRVHRPYFAVGLAAGSSPRRLAGTLRAGAQLR